MNTKKLTQEEHEHIKNVGRIFIIEEIPEQRWRILSISKKGTITLCKPTIPTTEEGYSDLEVAKNLAYGIAALSEDSPMVRVYLEP